MNIGLISYFLQGPHRFRVRHGECAGRERLGHAMSDGELVRHFGGVEFLTVLENFRTFPRRRTGTHQNLVHHTDDGVR